MSIAVQCVDDVLVKIKAVGEFGSTDREKVFYVYSEENLLEQTKLIKYPAVGVMYEGIIAGEGDGTRQGMQASLTVALALVMDSNVAGMDRKNEAARLLDLMRRALRTQTSPTGHKWQFVSEVPMGQVGGVLVYIQRWSAVVMLTSDF